MSRAMILLLAVPLSQTIELLIVGLKYILATYGTQEK